MTERITGRVVRVIDRERLVINRGAEDGVHVGMRFAILSPVTIDLSDPDDPERRHELPVARTVVKVTSVEEQFAIAQTFRTVKSSGVFGNLTAPSERPERLDAADTAVDEIDPAERTVKVRDSALEVLENGFEGVVLPF
ncbi:FlgT C-terminal domain-containing protein [Oerskovia rustica]|uniref:Flagellar assembly protein T C-terminal domain-containing protein n=1 Tax=Oerskovia rustica TaxID=2762237 RepID=A0ABR8RQ54_9CELL|nr:FlgT C-terminal domain-containing protein [Oerskovia rustica]MBD7949920.1 hypothetical protein [Oerskovia rustica]